MMFTETMRERKQRMQEAVSYTHLDVYKRQARLLARLLFLGSVVVRHFGRFVLRNKLRVLIQALRGPREVILTVNFGVVGRSMCSFVSVIRCV